MSNISRTNQLIPVFPATLTAHVIDAQFVLIGQWGFTALGSGVLLLFLRCFTEQITDREFGFPKRRIFWIGFAQALSSVLMVYASSGTRTAPYLQGLLSACTVPIQFAVR